MASRVAKGATEVYRGYMPIDLPQHRSRKGPKPWWKVQGKPRVTLYPKKEEPEFTEEPNYPSLNDGSKSGLKTQVRLDWYESLKSLPTVDQKMYEISRHATHYMPHINNWLKSYNSLPLAQYATHTCLIDTLPDRYSSKREEREDPNYKITTERVKQSVLDQIAIDKFETIHQSPKVVSKNPLGGEAQTHVSNRFVQNLINNMKLILATEANPQLMEYQYDLSPTIRSWWFHSGFPAPNNKVYYRSREDDEGNINQIIQMDGSSAMNIRSDNLIEPIVSQTDSLVTDSSLVQKFSHPLKHYGARYKFRWPVALSGFWFEDEPEFDCPHTCIMSADCIELRHSRNYKVAKELDDNENCLQVQAIMTAFGWLNSLSMYHGFTPFQELEYPLTCQVITTDGKNWLFNVYQLNTHTFHKDLGGAKKNNICWSSGVKQLYQEYKGGQFKGVNEEVIDLLIRFLSQKNNPDYTSQLNLRPHLGADVRTDEERDQTRSELRKLLEGRTNKWMAHQWKVPLFEHIFFRSPEGRHRIKHMKAEWHIPKPKTPKIFD